LGCTVSELLDRISSEEILEWWIVDRIRRQEADKAGNQQPKAGRPRRR
jgi:hypothetical protein